MILLGIISFQAAVLTHSEKMYPMKFAWPQSPQRYTTI